jgi:hypothetical protein
MHKLNEITAGLLIGWLVALATMGQDAPLPLAPHVALETGDESSPADSGVSVATPAPESPAPDVAKYVHSIVVNGIQKASCVLAGNGRVAVTATHVLMDNQFRLLSLRSLSIDGKPVAFRVQHFGRDLSLIHSSAIGDGAECAKEPWHGARVLLYGCETAKVQHGTFHWSGTFPYVQIDDGDPGITQGDSGGGVFTEDGNLIGVISAFAGNVEKGTADKRRVFFAPLSEVSALVAPSSRAESSEPPPGAANKPAIRIISPATWDCTHCPGMLAQDWSGFDMQPDRRDGLPGYPCTEWTDKRGVIRRLYGKYTPGQVAWSYRETMR